MRSTITLTLLVALVAVATLSMTGCSDSEREELQNERDANFAARQWDEGVFEFKKGFKQLDEFDQKLAEAEPKSAERHLKKCAECFGKARTHFAKAEVGREHKSAIDDINAGGEAFDKAVSEYEAGNMDSAQSHLDKAQKLFAKAATNLEQ